MIVKLRWSTPVVRRDQDGGKHCSESRIQRFPFLRFRFHASFAPSRARAPSFRFPLGPRSARAKEERREPRSRSLSSLVARDGGGKNEKRIFRGPSPGRAKVESVDFLHFGRASSSRYDEWIGFGRDSDNGKLEDLVRLALKRLNISYLTILSRLVWFERETLVCHGRGCEEDICDSFRWISNDRILFTCRQRVRFFFLNCIIHPIGDI